VKDASKTQNTSDKLEIVPSAGDDIALPISENRTVVRGAEGYWQPSVEQIAEYRSVIRRKLDETCGNNVPELAKRYDKYNCQYVGFVEQLQKCILANCMCRVRTEWKTKFISTNSGGICFLSVLARTDSNGKFEIYSLHVHDEDGLQECPDYFVPDLRR
jgi:hypothetical protein